MKTITKKPVTMTKAHPAVTASALAMRRDAQMRTRGYVSVAVAAAGAKTPRANIYHWVTVGKLRMERWGKFIYVNMADLQALFPIAFAPTGKSAKAG